MNDLISRQAAIDALNVGAELLRRVLDDADVVGAERAKYEWGLELIESYISDMEDLPSAQPEVRTEMSSPKNSERTTESSQNVQDDDLISRKAAIEAFWELDIETRPSWIDAVMRVLKEIPSAQPERTEYIPDTKAIPSERDCVDLSEKVTVTFYDDEYEEWSQKTVMIRDVLDSVCDEYTILPSAQPDRSLWFRIGEICVDESKGFISAGRAVEKIRELLREVERMEE